MLFICYFFFFKQKTAYEMRISDWSSDVCSSDLAEHLLHLVARATESERLKFEYERLREKAGPADELTGTSAAINNVRATLKRVAGTGSRVLITGAPGVGKGVAARVLHGWSGGQGGAFRVRESAPRAPQNKRQ